MLVGSPPAAGKAVPCPNLFMHTAIMSGYLANPIFPSVRTVGVTLRSAAIMAFTVQHQEFMWSDRKHSTTPHAPWQQVRSLEFQTLQLG